MRLGKRSDMSPRAMTALERMGASGAFSSSVKSSGSCSRLVERRDVSERGRAGGVFLFSGSFLFGRLSLSLAIAIALALSLSSERERPKQRRWRSSAKTHRVFGGVGADSDDEGPELAQQVLAHQLPLRQLSPEVRQQSRGRGEAITYRGEAGKRVGYGEKR